MGCIRYCAFLHCNRRKNAHAEQLDSTYRPLCPQATSCRDNFPIDYIPSHLALLPTFPQHSGVSLAISYMPRSKNETKNDEQLPEHGRILDRGVWKEYKVCPVVHVFICNDGREQHHHHKPSQLCEHCRKMMVMRAKWRDNWPRFCSHRCKAEARAVPGVPNTDAPEDSARIPNTPVGVTTRNKPLL